MSNYQPDGPFSALPELSIQELIPKNGQYPKEDEIKIRAELQAIQIQQTRSKMIIRDARAGALQLTSSNIS